MDAAVLHGSGNLCRLMNDDEFCFGEYNITVEDCCADMDGNADETTWIDVDRVTPLSLAYK